jgi:hypothetical protein
MDELPLEKRIELAESLSFSPSVRRAARAAGVSESTARRWLRDAGFRSLIDDARRALIRRIIGPYVRAAAKGGKRLEKLVDDADGELALKAERAAVADLAALMALATLVDRGPAQAPAGGLVIPNLDERWEAGGGGP